MFMNEADLEDVEEIRVTSKFVRPSTASSQGNSNSLSVRVDSSEPEVPAFRSAGALGTPSTSRARMFAQQRDNELKKRQAAVQSGGMIRSSIDSVGTPGSNRDGQFTPAIRQFSQPRVLQSAEGVSEFARRSGDEGKPASRPRIAKYSDDEDDDDDDIRRPSQRNRGQQSNHNQQSHYRDSPARGSAGGQYNSGYQGRGGGSNSSSGNGNNDYRGDGRGDGRGGYDNYRDDRNDYRGPVSHGRGRGDDDYMRGSGGGHGMANNNYNNPSYDDGNYHRGSGGGGGGGRADDRYNYDGYHEDGNNGSGGGYAGTPNRNDRIPGYGNLTPTSTLNQANPGVNYGSSNLNTNYGNAPANNSAAMVASPSRPLSTVPDLSNMRRFLTTPLPKSCGVLQCYIRRNRTGTNKLFPIYSLYLKEGDVFLMASKKRPKNKTSNYLISSDQSNLNRGGPHYLGKLRSNFVGTEFQIFDDGLNPKDSEADEGPAGGNTQVRCELGAVMYAANVMGSRGPRKMQVALPGLDENNSIIRWKDGSGPSHPGYSNPNPNPMAPDDMLTRIKDRNLRDLIYLINKPPRWNEQVGAYVLNFNGRVTMASVKNFQLVDPEEQNTVVLQFGRVGKEEFTMDMQYPISPFQAFAVTLSSFDSKIACD